MYACINHQAVLAVDRESQIAFDPIIYVVMWSHTKFSPIIPTNPRYSNCWCVGKFPIIIELRGAFLKVMVLVVVCQRGLAVYLKGTDHDSWIRRNNCTAGVDSSPLNWATYQNPHVHQIPATCRVKPLGVFVTLVSIPCSFTLDGNSLGQWSFHQTV